MIDDGVDTDCRLAGRTIADDQLSLATANRDHSVDRHDARLHRLSNGTSPDDSGREVFYWIGNVTLDRTLAIEGLAQSTNDAAEQTFADRHLQEFASRANFVTLFKLRVVAHDHHADFGLIEIQRQAGEAATKIDHFIKHGVAEAFDSRNTVAYLANDTHVLFRSRCLCPEDLRINLYQ